MPCKPARCASAGYEGFGRLMSRFWKSSGSSVMPPLNVFFKIPEPVFEPVGLSFGGSRPFRQSRNSWACSGRERVWIESNFRESLVEAVHLLADERVVKCDLRVQELQTNFSGRGSQFERGAAAIQNSHGVQGTGTIGGRLKRQVQRRI